MTYKEGVDTIEEYKSRYGKDYALLKDKNESYSIVGIQYVLSNYEHLKHQIVLTTHKNLSDKLYGERKKATL